MGRKPRLAAVVSNKKRRSAEAPPSAPAPAPPPLSPPTRVMRLVSGASRRFYGSKPGGRCFLLPKASQDLRVQFTFSKEKAQAGHPFCREMAEECGGEANRKGEQTWKSPRISPLSITSDAFASRHFQASEME